MKAKVFDQDKQEILINKFVDEKSPTYLEIYATGVEGGPFGPYDFRLNFYEESLEKDKNSKFFLQKIHKARVVMSYAAAKQLADWLNKHLDNYEAKSGQKIYLGEKD